MRRKSNVNPDHYKTAGRERPGQGVVQEVNKKKYTEAKRRYGRGYTQAEAEHFAGRGVARYV